MFDYWYFFYYYLVLWVIFGWVCSIYTHRGVCHRVIECSPAIVNFSRFLTWFVGSHYAGWQKIWAATHRKHHIYADTESDPHSPHIWGIKILLPSSGQLGEPYHITPQDMTKYAPDIETPNDWVEHHVFNKLQGKYFYHAVNLILFGPIGTILGFLLLWPISNWIVIHAYISHKFGIHYEKNLLPNDRSINLFPIGIIFAGEDLAANHHNNPRLAKLSKRWYEFDSGWCVIKILSFLRLVKITGTTEKI